MREMRLHKREVKDTEDLRHILESCKVVRVGAVDEEGMFIVPVNFGYLLEETQEGSQNLKLYFHGAASGRKADTFSCSPEVAFEMDGSHALIRGDYACSYSYAYESIMGNGRIRVVEDHEEKIYGLSLIMKHLDADSEIFFSEDALTRTKIYCIEASHFTGKRRTAKA